MRIPAKQAEMPTAGATFRLAHLNALNAHLFVPVLFSGRWRMTPLMGARQIIVTISRAHRTTGTAVHSALPVLSRKALTARLSILVTAVAPCAPITTRSGEAGGYR